MVPAMVLFSSHTAGAADLTGPELASMFHGKTAYIDFAPNKQGTGGGLGSIYYYADGKVVGRAADGKVRTGMRIIKDNTTCLTWEGSPPAPCARLEKDGDKLKVIGVDGTPLGTIMKIVDGNPEKL